MRYKIETHLEGWKKITKPFTVHFVGELKVGDTITPKCKVWVVDSVVKLPGKVQFGDTLL